MLIENKLGGHVIFTLVSVMAKSGPLKKIDCLNIVLPYVESHSELLSRLELRVGILLGKRFLIELGTVCGKCLILCISNSAFLTIIPWMVRIPYSLKLSFV